MHLHSVVLDQITSTDIAGLNVRIFDYSDEIEKRGWFLLFTLFWTTQFIDAVGQIVTALTIVKYYFTRDVRSVSAWGKRVIYERRYRPSRRRFFFCTHRHTCHQGMYSFIPGWECCYGMYGNRRRASCSGHLPGREYYSVITEKKRVCV